MSTLATILDKHVWIKTFRGRNRLNIWNLVLWGSGEGKSILMQNELLPTLNYVSKETNGLFVLPSVASSFEGITDWAIEHGLRGTAVRDEATTFFKESRSGYTSNVQETYSLVYDGWIMPRATRKVQVHQAIPVYFNLVGGATPQYMFSQMGPEFFFQGVGNRIDFERPKEIPTHLTFEEVFPITNVSDLEHYGSSDLDREQQEFADMLVKIVKVLHKKEYYILTLTEDVAKMSTEYLNKKVDEKYSIVPESRFAFKREYINRDWQKSLKYAGLLAFSESKMIDDALTGEVVMLEEKHIDSGQKIAEHNLKQFDNIITEWMGFQTRKKGDMWDTLGVALNYLSIVKTFDVISSTLLAAEVGNPGRNKTFYETIDFLEESGCIKKFGGDEAKAWLSKMSNEQKQAWMIKQMINPAYRRPPMVYKFVMDMPVPK